MEILPEFYLKFTLAGSNYVCRLLNLQVLGVPFQIGDHVSCIVPNQGKLACSLKLILICASLSIQNFSFLFFKHLSWLASDRTTYLARWLCTMYLLPSNVLSFLSMEGL